MSDSFWKDLREITEAFITVAYIGVLLSLLGVLAFVIGTLGICLLNMGVIQ